MKKKQYNSYVAFTSAKRFLYVTWPKIRMMSWGDYKPRRKSRFLKEFD